MALKGISFDNATGKIKQVGSGSVVIYDGSVAVQTIKDATNAKSAISIANTTGVVTIPEGLVVSGNLTVNGTTTTVNSNTITVDDPIFTLGGDTAPSSDDNKDRGIEFRWHNGTSAKVGFFGYDDSASVFTFIPDATNTSETFSGTAGNVAFGNISGVLTTGAQPNITQVGTISTGVWQGTAIASAYIASGLDAAKIADGSVSNTEFQYLAGVTSAIQTQLNAKQDTLTFGIADGNAVDIDSGASIAQNDYAKFSSTGLIGQTYAEVQTDLSVDDLITLSGVSEGSTNLATFTGNTIPDNQTIKEALQALETGLEGLSSASNSFDTTLVADTSGIAQNDILVIDAGKAAVATNNSRAYVLGICSGTASSGSPARVYKEGQVISIGANWSTGFNVGDPIYLSISGTFTKTPPTQDEVIRLGHVAVAANPGKLLYRVQHIMTN